MVRALAALLLLVWPVVGHGQNAPTPRPETSTESDRPVPKPADAQTQGGMPHSLSEGDIPATDGATAEKPQPAKQSASGPTAQHTPQEDDFAYSACLLDLSILGAEFIQSAPISDPQQPDCGIDRPITLTAPLPGILIHGGAVMRCETAWHLAHWLKDFVRPAAALLPGQPRLAAIEPGSTYQCRATVGDDAAKLSEHAFGNAFDLAAFDFSDGRRIEIAPRKDEGDLTEAFQQAVRGAACLHFTTVLGPGSNAAHDNHLHLDIKARKNGWRLCQ